MTGGEPGTPHQRSADAAGRAISVIIVADRVEDASRFRRLTEEEVAPWAEEFGMGEIWEKTLVGGRP